MAIAMAAYPGGSHFNPTSTGHQFWSNYLCDLLNERALNTKPNPVASSLTRVALVVLNLGLLALWYALPLLLPRQPVLGAWVRRLGTLSVLAGFTIPFTREALQFLHAKSIVLAGLPALVAVGLVSVAAFKESVHSESGHEDSGHKQSAELRALSVLGATLFLLSGSSFALYVSYAYFDGVATELIPTLQKLAALLLLAWMLWVAKSLYRFGRRQA